MQSSKLRPATGERLRAHSETEIKQQQRGCSFFTTGSKRPTLNTECPTPKLQSDFEVGRSMFSLLLWGFCKKIEFSHFSEKFLKLFLSDLERTRKDRILNQKPINL